MAGTRRELPLMNQATPPPTIEQLHKLQLIRTTLVKFIDWKDFDDVVRGCFVRVLLEMRAEDRTRDGQDSYYVAIVKGAKKGPSYTGFSWDGISTEWHIIIELPPCFKSSPNGNLVQLSSISNTPFKPNEYQQWIQMTKEMGGSFMSEQQIALRLQVLQENYQKAVGIRKQKKTGAKAGAGNGAAAAADEALASQAKEARKKAMEQQIRSTHLLLPIAEKLTQLKVPELHEIEQQCLNVLQTIRSNLNERTKCQQCHDHVCSVVCYPCKHRVLCSECAKSVTTCPVASCRQSIQQKFEVFSS